MPSVHTRSGHGADGYEALSGRAGTTAAQTAHRGRTCRPRVAAPIPIKSGVERHRHKSEWGAALPASAHAHFLVLRQRTAETGALLPGAVTAAVAVHSGTGA